MAGDNAFTLTPQQWINTTNAIGIVSKSGRYGGTYAHTDIAIEFASWISPVFKLYIIKDYQRLKKAEADILNMALFGKTAAQWRKEHEIKGKTPNIRDYASAEELVVLINLEDTNSDLIRQGLPQLERLKILREKLIGSLSFLRKIKRLLKI